MNKVKHISLIFIFALLFIQCTCSKKNLQKAENAALMEAQSIIKTIEQRAIPNSISARAKVNYSGNGQKITFKSQLAAKRDEYILINFKKLGFEAARAYLTPDSVFVINRLKRTYIAESYDFVEQEFNLPFDFEGVQAFVWGTPYFLNKNKTTAETVVDKYLLKSKEDGIEASYTISAPDFLMESMLFNQVKEQRTATLEFEQHQTVQNYTLPYFRKIDVKSGETSEVGIIFDIHKMVLNEDKSIRFEIPKNYKRVTK